MKRGRKPGRKPGRPAAPAAPKVKLFYQIAEVAEDGTIGAWSDYAELQSITTEDAVNEVVEISQTAEGVDLLGKRCRIVDCRDEFTIKAQQVTQVTVER